MKAKKDFLLRSVCEEDILVPVGEESQHFNGLIRLNSTGVWLWKQLEEELSEEELVQRMCDHYAGLDKDTAARDLKEFLDTVKPALA